MSETSLLFSCSSSFLSSSSSFSPSSFVLPSEILGDDDDGVCDVNSFFPYASKCPSRFSCSRAKGLLLLFLLVVVTAVSSFTSAFDASDDDAISSHSLLLRVARVYNQEEVDFLRRNAAANEKNANKQKIKERIFQRKESSSLLFFC
jgi:hypothetical protein